MAACNNCYLFDQLKLHAKVGFFKARKHMVIFILNVLLNIENLHFDFCACTDESICYPCFLADIYDEDQVYAVYKNCLDLDFLSRFKEDLHTHLCRLFDAKSHFLCQIITEQLYNRHKCFFTGYIVNIKVETAYQEWEKIKINEIIKKDAKVIISDWLKQNRLLRF